jgi:hypothetical protein
LATLTQPEYTKHTTGSLSAYNLAAVGLMADYYTTLAVELAKRCSEAVVREAEAETVRRLTEGR